MLQINRYTVDQEQAIEELKSRIEHELLPNQLNDETFYYRFLKARGFNIEYAEKMIRKHISDIQLYDLSDILTNYNEAKDLSIYLPASFVGYDKEGSTVRYVDLGRSDHKGVLTLYSFREIVRYCAEFMERDLILLTEQTRKTGKQISEVVFIIDMDQLNLFKVTYKKALETAYEGFKLFQDNYPERIKSVVVINASFYFNMALAVIKPVLSAALLEKISIYGKTGWKEVLLNKIDADVLPVFLGGNRTDENGDPFCNSFINFGQKVPDSLLQKNTRKPLSEEEGTQKLTVTRFSCTELMFYVEEPKAYLEWEFETKARDIAFGLNYRDNSKENPVIEELIPKQRTDTLLSAETGVYKCDKIGTYIIVFDNSHSWIFSKEIYYRVRLVPSKEGDTI